MKLRNKKTGEIVEKYPDRFVINSGEQIRQYASLAELNEEWEDYEKPKDNNYWYIDVDGEIMSKELGWFNQAQDEIGNRFESEEEAEKAVERLRAWKRLKDKGFVFKGINMGDGSIKTGLTEAVSLDDCEGFYSDMELLFGGAE